MLDSGSTKIILASASQARASLLRNAAIEFEIIPADVDESTIRDVMAGPPRAKPEDIAEVLARHKAESISALHPDAIVIGADQILALGDEIFEKPADMDAARDALLQLKGKTHSLISAVCVARKGETVWSHVESADLTMRDFSPEFLGQYLAAAGDNICSSVGAYQLESLGIHLFEEIKGDYFTILGLPLLPLLAYLREAT